MIVEAAIDAPVIVWCGPWQPQKVPDAGCGEARIVERDLDGNALHDFGEVAGGVVGRQQRKLRSAGRRNLDDFAAE